MVTKFLLGASWTALRNDATKCGESMHNDRIVYTVPSKYGNSISLADSPLVVQHSFYSVHHFWRLEGNESGIVPKKWPKVTVFPVRPSM